MDAPAPSNAEPHERRLDPSDNPARLANQRLGLPARPLGVLLGKRRHRAVAHCRRGGPVCRRQRRQTDPALRSARGAGRKDRSPARDGRDGLVLAEPAQAQWCPHGAAGCKNGGSVMACRTQGSRTNSLPLLAAAKPVNTSLTVSQFFSFFMLASQRCTFG